LACYPFEIKKVEETTFFGIKISDLLFLSLFLKQVGSSRSPLVTFFIPMV
jgi:hypothetical protein